MNPYPQSDVCIALFEDGVDHLGLENIGNQCGYEDDWCTLDVGLAVMPEGFAVAPYTVSLRDRLGDRIPTIVSFSNSMTGMTRSWPQYRFQDSLAHVSLDQLGVGTSTHSTRLQRIYLEAACRLFSPVELWPDAALRAKMDRRSRPQEISRTKTKFVPSVDLCRFVLLADERPPKEGRHARLTEPEASIRKEHVMSALFGLLQSIANSIARRGESEYSIASDGLFEDSFAKALLFRIEVAVYGQALFLETLFSELSSSQVSATEWRLDNDAPGSLVLKLEEVASTPKRIPRNRAAPVRLKMTQFPES